MGEFVEQSLEQLVPVFEQLQAVSILAPEEVEGLVKRCRRYEYRLQKREKTPVDFHMFADYLSDVVALVRSRRQRLDYWHKKDLIDKPLLMKAASVYRRCCDRFQADFSLWRKLFEFLDGNRMRKQLSRAYTRALQVHGRNTDLRIEAALWEFFSNASAENARTQLQLAVRMSPDEHRYYAALFKLEVNFVDKIMQRRQFLQDTAKKMKKDKKGGDEDGFESGQDESVFDVDVDDAVLQLKIAEIVMKSGLRGVAPENAGTMLLEMWSILGECQNLPKEAQGRLAGEIEAKLQEMNNEDTQLLEIKKAVMNKEDELDAYDDAVKRLPSEKMHRLFLGLCERRLAKDAEDLVAEMKKGEILAAMLEKGWIQEKDFKTLTSSLDEVVSNGEKLKLLDQAIKANPSSVVFWEAKLKHRLDNDQFDSDEEIKSMLDELNSAFEKVALYDSYPLWEVALEFAIAHTPEQVEAVFSRAFLVASPSVASKVKILRLGFLGALVADEKLRPEERRRHVLEMMNSKPNSPEFYLAVAEQELGKSGGDVSLAKSALNFSINENGAESVESWIEFIRFALKHEPATVGQLHQRAMMQLDSSLCSDFIGAWTALQQEEAAAALSKENVTFKRSAAPIDPPAPKKKSKKTK